MRWYEYPRWSHEYEKGLDEYIEDAFAARAQGEQISCPCEKCCYRFWFHDKSVVKDHVILNGFVPRSEHQAVSPVNVEAACEHFDDWYTEDDIDGLLHDTLRNDPTEETKAFYKLLQDGQDELYPGCKNFSKLSFTIRLFLFKCQNKVSNNAFNDLLTLLRAMLPEAKFPSSYNEAKNVIKGLGLNYLKIDACPNDCMLYWEDNANATHCHVCKSPRWKPDERVKKNGKPRQIPFKVLRYFPIKKRLQRLYMCTRTSCDMTWHSDGRPKDNLLRHPTDGQSWKDFDLAFPKFAEEPRNVRLGLSTDGFNPFSTMSISHSTWPVILMNYNLPPWMCMKPEFFMLALLIPGRQSPGNDIDVYMQPLIKELKELWDFGLETYDASTKQMFRMRAALLFTISDFPAYSMLSGWSTKGKTACPNCHYETCSEYLGKSKKHCYMGHERFLDQDHPLRDNIDASMKESVAPTRLKGDEILELLADFQNDFGKTEDRKKKEKKRAEDGIPWRKKPIFFELPYWKSVSCGHYLDVMHIEKNVCDSLLATLLGLPKSKDHMNARLDMEHLSIMPELHVRISADGKTEMPKSKFWLSKDKRRTFCSILKNAKLPQDCGSNIARCVQVDEGRIVGYKSHDAHLIMQHLLPIAVRSTLPREVALPLMTLSYFFRKVCSKVINPEDLEKMQSDIVQTLCELEKIFPPSFFDIMVHLTAHLVEEIKLGGPPFSKWMYPIERYLRILKSYVRNKSHPEGSIAEGYIAEECLTFCARYLCYDLNALSKEKSIEEEFGEGNEPQPLLSMPGCPIMGQGNNKRDGAYKIDAISWDQAHKYVLFNCDLENVENYIMEHQLIVSQRKKRKWDSTHIHSRDFVSWFKEKVQSEMQQGEEVLEHIKWLSRGPSFISKKYSGYSINGYKFHTADRDANSVTENSGVTLKALTPSFSSTKDQNPIVGDVTYYGSIQEIIEIHYQRNNKVVLFRCKWFYAEKDDYGLTRINRTKSICEEEPFIFASQAQQVFFVNDPKKQGWQFVVQNPPKEFF